MLTLLSGWDKIFSLAENPKRFAVIPEVGEFSQEIRDMNHYSHRIVYWVRDAEQTVEILRVYHGSRRPLTPKDIDV